jgi:hypothetical protein
MPSTVQNVAWIHNFNPKYSPAQCLQFLDRVHRMCVQQEIDQFLKIDSTTGMPPYLTTQANQYVYDCPTDCRKTSKIAVEARDLGYISSYYAYRTMENYRYEEFQMFGKTYYRLPYIHSRDATYDQPAQVIFGGKYNPAPSDQLYWHFYWVKANPLETMDDQMQLPEELHDDICTAIAQYMASQDYGSTGQDQLFIANCMKNVRNKMNKGALGRIGRTPWRMEFRDF